jgi:hypothetical protein
MPGLCDFCSAPDAAWRYPARSFIGYIAGGVVGESVGDWAACHECHQLIVSDNRVRLTETSVLTFIARHPELQGFKSELATQMEILHAQFFDNRTGPASAIA